MEGLQQMIMQADLVTTRAVLRLVLLSLIFTVACMAAFPRNAPSRRFLLLGCVGVLLLVPAILGWFELVWRLPTQSVVAFTLNEALPNLLVYGWLAVALVLCGVHLRQVFNQSRQLAQLPQITDATVLSELQSLAQSQQVEPPQLVMGTSACSTTIGQCLIILPPNWSVWDSATLTSVLAHELVHIRRSDDRWLLLTRLMLLTYWWMPWLRWLYRAFVRAMEESCDDAASELVGRSIAYAGALADAAGIASTAYRPTAYRPTAYRNVASMAEHHLVGRIGRFGQLRALELDAGGIYWLLLVVLGAVLTLTGVQPEVAKETYNLSPGFSKGPSASIGETYVLNPVEIYDYTELSPHAHDALKAQVATPTYRAPAIYPGSALRARISGNVTVEFGISLDGSVAAPTILHSEPAGVFDAAALNAVRGSRYPYAHKAANVITTTAGVTLPRHSDESQQQRVQRSFRFRVYPTE